MSVLLIIKFNNPNNVFLFPPSVPTSPWMTSLSEYLKTHAAVIEDEANNLATTMLLFPDESAANNFISTYALTDPSLKADIDAWKAAHGITYEFNFYSLSSNTTINNNFNI